MALTLPYPDMVFVPLDILTAEEQNQLVGNIEFLANQFPLAASNIANGAIGSAQLADEAVTADKIDFSTSGYVYKDETINKAVSATSTQLLTIDVSQFPAGAVLEAIGGAELTGNDVAPYTRIWTAYGGASSLAAGAVTTWGRAYFSVGTLTKASGSDSVILYARIDRSDLTSNAVRAYLSAKRVR